MIGVLAILLTGCSDTESSTSNEALYASTDSAGVQLAVTRWQDPSPVVGWTISAEPTVVFGESGTEPVEFYDIDDGVRLSDDRVVVLDSGAKELLYFSGTGELQAKAGAAGDGPGEFRDPAGLVELSGDTLCVFARRGQQLSLFDRDGNWLEDRPLEEVDGLMPTRQFRLADAHDGSVIINNPNSFRISANMEHGEVHNPSYRFSTDGTFEGTVGEPSTMWIQPMRVLFDGKRIADAAGGRIYVKDAGQYEIRVYTYDGELLRIHRLMRPARQTSQEDVGRYKEFYRRNVANAALRDRLIAGLDRAMLADSFPALEHLQVDASGNVWVREYEPPWVVNSSYGVFAADGPWLGTITLPSNFRPLEIGSDYLLGVQTDELDVQHLVLYGLER